jgi:hypothetical protein
LRPRTVQRRNCHREDTRGFGTFDRNVQPTAMFTPTRAEATVPHASFAKPTEPRFCGEFPRSQDACRYRGIIYSCRYRGIIFMSAARSGRVL